MTRQEQQNKMNELLSVIRSNGGNTGVFRIDDTENLVISIVGGRYGEDVTLRLNTLSEESITQVTDSLEEYVTKMEEAITREGTISSWERALR